MYRFDTVQDHRSNGSFRWGIPGNEKLIGMGTADLDYTCAPCIREALLPIAEENTYNYRQHSERYYNAVTGWYRRNYGLDIRREWLSNIPSTIGALRMALGIWAKPGDAVLVQSPCFGPISACIAGAGCRQVNNPLVLQDGHYALDLADFEEKLRTEHPAVFLLVNPHNPTCKVFTAEELSALTALCKKYSVKIISDEVHSLILYDSRRHIPILAIPDASSLAVQVVSMSKGYNIMGLPHAIVTIADDAMRTEWDRQIAAYSFGYAVNAFAIAAVTVIAEGKADGWMTELNAYLAENRRLLLEVLSQPSIPLTPISPEGSFLIWVDCRQAGIPAEELGSWFRVHAGIDLDNGTDFGTDGNGFVRINFAVTRDVLSEAIRRIQKAFSASAE